MTRDLDELFSSGRTSPLVWLELMTRECSTPWTPRAADRTGSFTRHEILKRVKPGFAGWCPIRREGRLYRFMTRAWPFRLWSTNLSFNPICSAT